MNLPDLDRIDPAALALAFPPGFLWGAATSAAQIEGAAFEDGKAASIWDTFCRQPGRINDASNIDVACDHYHRFRDDVALMSGMGLDCYRFSFAWPRVQPAGQGVWNEPGFAFYDRLIDALLEAGLQPHGTLYHWDLPQALHESIGGWLSRDVAPRFADYAAEIARRFGDRLASIATHNEPWCTATLGYETGQFAPGHQSRAESLQVAHHLMLSHGDAIAAMRAVTKAPLGIVLNHTPSFAATPTEEDRRAARIDDGLNVRWYMDPIFRGAYPQDAIEHVGADAPAIEAGDLDRIRQPLDFLGINFYTRGLFGADGKTVKGPGKRGFTDMGWEIVPEVFAQHLVRLAREYSPPPMFITENGMANADVVVGAPQPHVPDVERIAYLSSHLKALATAMSLGADVRGYFYWSLLDNFEWNSGYTKRFGLFHVDYDTQARLAKDSAHWYRDFIDQHHARR